MTAEELVADWPPFTEEQKQIIRALMRSEPSQAIRERKPLSERVQNRIAALNERKS